MFMKLKKIIIPLIVLALLTGTVGGTLAFLLDSTAPIENTFLPSEIIIDTYEEFDGEEKSNIYVQNNGTADAYVRIKLLGYWYDNQKDTIVAKQSWFDMESKNPNNGWFYKDGYYYYPNKVSSDGGKTEKLFNNAVKLDIDSSDGTRKVLEVIAEAIQAVPADAVEDAWEVTVNTNGTISK